jgi:hypothetical protein
MEIIKTIRRRTKVTKTKAGYSVEGSVEITAPAFVYSDATGLNQYPGEVMDKGNAEAVAEQVDLISRLEAAFPAEVPGK